MVSKLPVEVLAKIFSYLTDFRDLCNCSCVCRRWKDLLADDSNIWESILRAACPEKFCDDRLLDDVPNFKAKLAAYHCAWNGSDCSKNIFIKENKLTLHRNPVSQSSDAIRSKVGFVSGVHYWVVKWHGPKFGSTAVVGLATKDARLQDSGYYPLLGCDGESWGWDIPAGELRHGGQAVEKYPRIGDFKVTELYVLYCADVHAWRRECGLRAR